VTFGYSHLQPTFDVTGRSFVAISVEAEKCGHGFSASKMSKTFDPRIVPPAVANLARAIETRAAGVLGGGAALAGLHLHHRLSRDLDFFFATREEVRVAVSSLPDVAAELGLSARVLRDAGTFVRAIVALGGTPIEIDLVHEPVAPLCPPDETPEGIVVSSLPDLRASKLTCILSRAEPRDLVDLLFLDRSGHPPEHDIAGALTKDAGIDPATLAWLLRDFPLEPLPMMIVPLSIAELQSFRDDLARRFAAVALPNA
jgi:hypothetical protein